MNFDVLLSMKEMFYSYNHSIMGVYFTICMIFVWSMPRRSFFIYRILASIVICYFAIIPVNMISISVPLLSLTLKYLIITFLGIFLRNLCSLRLFQSSILFCFDHRPCLIHLSAHDLSGGGNLQDGSFR